MISIIVPVYNEEDNVQPLFLEIKQTLSRMTLQYEVLFVDDGSNDETLNNLRALLDNGENKGILRIIELRKNFGQTPALLAGLANAKGDYIVTMDGDQQNDPNDIPKLYEALTDEFDVICGWRKNRKDNILKRLPSKFNNYLNRRLTGLKIHDSGCTLRIYRKEAAMSMDLFAEGHRYIPAILAEKGFRLGEVETNHRPRTLGKTKYGFKRLFRGFTDMLTLHALRRWRKKPIHFFGRWAILFVLAGLFSGIWLLLERFAFYLFWPLYSGPVLIAERPLLVVCIGFFVTAIQLLLTGFLTEILVRGTTNPHDSYQIRKKWH